MKTYTKNEVEAIMLAGYKRGLEDGGLPRDRRTETKPPTLEELEINHPLTSSDDPAQVRQPGQPPRWLQDVPGGRPRS